MIKVENHNNVLSIDILGFKLEKYITYGIDGPITHVIGDGGLNLSFAGNIIKPIDIKLVFMCIFKHLHPNNIGLIKKCEITDIAHAMSQVVTLICGEDMIRASFNSRFKPIDGSGILYILTANTNYNCMILFDINSGTSSIEVLELCSVEKFTQNITSRLRTDINLLEMPWSIEEIMASLEDYRGSIEQPLLNLPVKNKKRHNTTIALMSFNIIIKLVYSWYNATKTYSLNRDILTGEDVWVVKPEGDLTGVKLNCLDIKRVILTIINEYGRDPEVAETKPYSSDNMVAIKDMGGIDSIKFKDINSNTIPPGLIARKEEQN